VAAYLSNFLKHSSKMFKAPFPFDKLLNDAIKKKEIDLIYLVTSQWLIDLK